jgi:hypothetical protein
MEAAKAQNWAVKPQGKKSSKAEIPILNKKTTL